MKTLIHEEKEVTTRTMRKMSPPEWLLAFWKEIDDKTFGKGFDCFTEDATCNLGIADWHGREQIRENLRAFIDAGFTARHDVVEKMRKRDYMRLVAVEVEVRADDSPPSSASAVRVCSAANNSDQPLKACTRPSRVCTVPVIGL